jgi:uroporphyrin-3 C-methyltransferase
MSDEQIGHDEQTQPSDDAVEESSTALPGNGLLKLVAVLALLVAVGAGGGVYWLWQQQQSAIHRQSTESKNSLAEMQAKLDARILQLSSAQAKADEAHVNLEKSLANLLEEVGRDRSAWAVAETVYFLQLANARLQLLQDVDTALEALTIADQRLQALADPGFTPVREKIKSEIAALQVVARTDVTGTALSIGALAAQIPTLPLHVPARHAEQPATQVVATTDEEQPLWRRELGKVWEVMRELIDVRRTDKRIEPLLKPEEQRLLVNNIQLQLQTARIAVVQRDTRLYKDSLNTAAEWIKSHYDMDAEVTAGLVAQINKLAVVDLSPALPDISASLRLLRSMSDKAARKPAK